MERTNKERMKATEKRYVYLSMDVSDKSGGRLVVVEFKFVTENCAVSMTAIYWCWPVFVVSFSLFAHLTGTHTVRKEDHEMEFFPSYQALLHFFSYVFQHLLVVGGSWLMGFDCLVFLSVIGVSLDAGCRLSRTDC